MGRNQLPSAVARPLAILGLLASIGYHGIDAADAIEAPSTGGVMILVHELELCTESALRSCTSSPLAPGFVGERDGVRGFPETVSAFDPHGSHDAGPVAAPHDVAVVAEPFVTVSTFLGESISAVRAFQRWWEPDRTAHPIVAQAVANPVPMTHAKVATTTKRNDRARPEWDWADLALRDSLAQLATEEPVDVEQRIEFYPPHGSTQFHVIGFSPSPRRVGTAPTLVTLAEEYLPYDLAADDLAARGRDEAPVVRLLTRRYYLAARDFETLSMQLWPDEKPEPLVKCSPECLLDLAIRAIEQHVVGSDVVRWAQQPEAWGRAVWTTAWSARSGVEQLAGSIAGHWPAQPNRPAHGQAGVKLLARAGVPSGLELVAPNKRRGPEPTAAEIIEACQAQLAATRVQLDRGLDWLLVRALPANVARGATSTHTNVDQTAELPAETAANAAQFAELAERLQPWLVWVSDLHSNLSRIATAPTPKSALR